MHYLALCLIAKDEDASLPEWIAHHALLGVEHFIIYDNDSAVPIKGLLRDFPESLITCHGVRGGQMQIPAYNDCLKTYGPRCRWIGFIDCDEFVYPVRDDDLRVTLSEYEEYAGLAVPWTMFGSSGHETPPEGLVIENYARRYGDTATGWHNIIKCFVNPAEVGCAVDPHRFEPAEGRHFVTERHFPVTPGSDKALRSDGKIRLNHYFFKSRQEFAAKIGRGRADREDEAARYPMSLFEEQLAKATVEDTAIQRFAPGVRAALDNPSGLPAPPDNDLRLGDIMDRFSALIEAGGYLEAEGLVRQAMARSEGASEPWVLRSMFARSGGAPDRAMAFARRAILLEQTPETAWELHLTLCALGREADARAALDLTRLLVHEACRDDPFWARRLAGR